MDSTNKNGNSTNSTSNGAVVCIKAEPYATRRLNPCRCRVDGVVFPFLGVPSCNKATLVEVITVKFQSHFGQVLKTAAVGMALPKQVEILKDVVYSMGIPGS